MKRIAVFFIVMASVFMLNMVSYAGPIVSIKFEFGRKSCNCCGFGICDFVIGIDPNFDNYSTQRDGEAIGQITFNGKTLIMSFLKESMTSYTTDKYFGSGFFVIAEDIVLPFELCEKLGLNSFTIKHGKYKIVENSKYLTVSL